MHAHTWSKVGWALSYSTSPDVETSSDLSRYTRHCPNQPILIFNNLIVRVSRVSSTLPVLQTCRCITMITVWSLYAEWHHLTSHVYSIWRSNYTNEQCAFNLNLTSTVEHVLGLTLWMMTMCTHLLLGLIGSHVLGIIEEWPACQWSYTHIIWGSRQLLLIRFTQSHRHVLKLHFV